MASREKSTADGASGTRRLVIVEDHVVRLGVGVDPQLPVALLGDGHRRVDPVLARLEGGDLRLVDDDVIYLYDRTPLESRVVVAN